MAEPATTPAPEGGAEGAGMLQRAALDTSLVVLQRQRRLEQDLLRANQNLEALVLDKEALLKEVHHRVKNNLQIINSLLRLEIGRSAQNDTCAVLRDMQSRIHAMALLHESLYRAGTFASVDLGLYLKQLVTQAFRAQAIPSGAVQLRLRLNPVQVDMDQATPCGLLVNELISNCLKHGFPEGRSGEIEVALDAPQSDGQVRLCVSDTGVGLPPDFEARRTQSLGLQLVSDLARQMGGVLAIGPGAAFAVHFKPEIAPSTAGAR